MEITWTKSLGEYDSFNPGPERSFTYTVRNTSAPFATNSLFGLVLPTGLHPRSAEYLRGAQKPNSYQSHFDSP